MSATLQEACYENKTAVYMALELSNKQWKVLIGDGYHHRHKTVDAGDIAGLLEQIAVFRGKWGVSVEAPVHGELPVTRRSRYEGCLQEQDWLSVGIQAIISNSPETCAISSIIIRHHATLPKWNYTLLPRKM